MGASNLKTVEYYTMDTPDDLIPHGFQRFVGTDGYPNHYGFLGVAIYSKKYNLRLKVYPLICGHGGSQWLCGSCMSKIVENPNFKKPLQR